MARLQVVTFMCDECGLEEVADKMPLGDGNVRHMLPAGWIRIEDGGIATRESDYARLKGEVCSAACAQRWLVEQGAREASDWPPRAD